jgi:hypothetical protein
MVPGEKEESVENGGYRHRSIRWQTQFYTVHYWKTPRNREKEAEIDIGLDIW